MDKFDNHTPIGATVSPPCFKSEKVTSARVRIAQDGQHETLDVATGGTAGSTYDDTKVYVCTTVTCFSGHRFGLKPIQDLS